MLGFRVSENITISSTFHCASPIVQRCPNPKGPKKYWYCPPKSPREKENYMDPAFRLIQVTLMSSLYPLSLVFPRLSSGSDNWVLALPSLRLFVLFYRVPSSTFHSGQIRALSNHWGLVKLAYGSLDYFPGPLNTLLSLGSLNLSSPSSVLSLFSSLLATLKHQLLTSWPPTAAHFPAFISSFSLILSFKPLSHFRDSLPKCIRLLFPHLLFSCLSHQWHIISIITSKTFIVNLPRESEYICNEYRIGKDGNFHYNLLFFLKIYMVLFDPFLRWLRIAWD